MAAPHRPRSQGPLPQPRQRPRGGRITCLLMPLHPERALSLALVQHLAGELRDIDFTLEERPGVDVLWVCGYERGNSALIRSLRLSHPHAELLVTAKEPKELWAGEVLAAGADSVFTWPVELAKLNRVLHRPALERRA